MSRIAVIIPCYKVTRHIGDVIARIPENVDTIYAVDDACPDGSGKFIKDTLSDPRIIVLNHQDNQGVGGAVKTGYARAFTDGHDIAVKIDGDGQMDPQLIEFFTHPIEEGLADYTKGNRFYDPRTISAMPRPRFIGNAGLSFLTKLSSGYWSIIDPTNGYTALHRTAYERLDTHLIDNRFFFETDMLARLNIVRAVVADVPMNAIYEDEDSNLNATREFGRFFFKNVSFFFKRLIYTYFVRGFSIASVHLLLGTIFLILGFIVGGATWYNSLSTGIPTTPGGAAMVIVLLILGNQMLLSFLAFDFASEPSVPLSRLLKNGRLSHTAELESVNAPKEKVTAKKRRS